MLKALKRGFFTGVEAQQLATFLIPHFEGLTEEILKRAEEVERIDEATDEELTQLIEETKKRLQ